MICPKCKKENDNFQTVCVYCGEPLTPGFVMCPVCGKVLKEGDAVCPRCHSKVYEKNPTINDKRQNSTRTPMYKALVPLSFTINLLILMVSILIVASYGIVAFTHGYFSNVSGVMMFAGYIIFFAFSLFTFINRVLINATKNVDKLEKKIISLKELLFADYAVYVFIFIFYFIPQMYTMIRLSNYGILDILYYSFALFTLIFATIFMPIFRKKARVRSR